MAKWVIRISKDGKLIFKRAGLTFKELDLLLSLSDDLFKANDGNPIFTEIYAEELV